MKYFYNSQKKFDFCLFKNKTINVKLLMKITTFIMTLLLITFNTIAKEPVYCKSITKKNGLYDSIRSARYTVMDKSVTLTVFNNYEKKLPKLSSNQMYYEFDLIKDHLGGRGKYRAVIKVQYSPRKIEASYLTLDHYETFCQIQ